MIIEYYVLNPTGNITALVVNCGIDESRYNTICSEIMKRHKTVEQVGFVDLNRDNPYLRMTGGEFCGNATMSAAALFHKLKDSALHTVYVEVYGSKSLFPINITENNNIYLTSISIDRPTDIRNCSFEIEANEFNFPIVFMDGIAHIIADKTLGKSDAELLVKRYCEALRYPAMGIMLYDNQTDKVEPLVYVKSCDTLFFENSCISGSCALAAYLGETNIDKTEASLIQPGGTIKTILDKNYNKIRLFGSVIIEKHLLEEIDI